ncbi:MAG: glycine cleavage system aminomethyltransferase GcvT [Sphaerochaetaceae bacterium]
MDDSALKTTPLYQEYKDYDGVKMIDFGGWLLPVNFVDGILSEHLSVREDVGMFDVSHMGECMITGPRAGEFLDMVVTNDVEPVAAGHALYTLMCYPNGTVVDDLMIYCLEKGSRYFVVMNASNVEKDLAWLREHLIEGVRIEDLSSSTTQIAVQGPDAEMIVSRIYPRAVELGAFDFHSNAVIEEFECIISRTGYTGEDGFEIYSSADGGRKIWNTLYDLGVPPCGLGARDSLRMEAKLPLYGHEISDEITPLEANLGAFVDLEKPFIGRDALAAQKEQGIPRSLRGFEMVDPGVARNGYDIFSNGSRIGYVTSGTKSPSLDKFVGYGMVERNTGLKFGDLIQISIHGKLKDARLVRTPFCKHGKKAE